MGGSCSGGICQPLLLGTVPITDFADETVVLGGKIYVFSDSSQTGNRTDVWQVDANTPGTPTEVTTTGQVSCIMNGQLFWTTYNSPQQMFSCTISNCAATTTPIVTLATGVDFGGSLRCDQTNNELVWRTTTDGSTFTIRRASSTGANARTITSVQFLNDGASWVFLYGGTQAGRFFYSRTVTTITPTSTTQSVSLYYVATDVVNGAGIAIVSNVDGIADIITSVTNEATVLVSGSISGSPQEWSVPLPNGVISGTPPTFAPGSIVSGGGVFDQTNFYGVGANSTVPSDGLVKCPLSGCTSPTILFRGQSSPFAFADDGTAIYWTTNAFTGTNGFSIWKAAK